MKKSFFYSSLLLSLMLIGGYMFLTSRSAAAAPAVCTFTRNLYVGSRDDQNKDVTCLQDYLTAGGYFTYSGGSTGYYGFVTVRAVASWQRANNVFPAVGYFGCISRDKYYALLGTRPSGAAPPCDTTATTPQSSQTTITQATPRTVVQSSSSIVSQSERQIWDETEGGGWIGKWTQREKGGNIYDMVQSYPDLGVNTAVLTITMSGTNVSVQRRQSSDGNDCDYTGTLASDMHTVTGTYTCFKVAGTHNWQAKIRSYDNRVSTIYFSIFNPQANQYVWYQSGWVPPGGWLIYDSTKPEWAAREIKNMMSADLDIVFHQMTVEAGDPKILALPQIIPMPPEGMTNFFETYRSLVDQGYEPPKVGEYVDHGSFGGGYYVAVYGEKLDLSTTKGRTYYYNTLIAPFWTQYFNAMGSFSDAFLAKKNGKVMISFDGLSNSYPDITGLSNAFLEDMKIRFKAQFGYNMYVLAHPFFGTPEESTYTAIDETHNNFGPSDYFYQGGSERSTGKQTAELLPGFWKAAQGGDSFLYVARSGGGGYLSAWQKALALKGQISNHLGITSWNYYPEGDVITESQTTPNPQAINPHPEEVWGPTQRYFIDQTALYASQWNDVPVNDAEFMRMEVPTSMVAGQTYTGSVTFRNTGDSSWTGAKGYKLVLVNSVPGIPNEILLNDSEDEIPVYGGIFRGRTKTFTFSLAPTTAGTYNLQWRMMQHGGESFGDVTSVATVEVKAPSTSGVPSLSLGVSSTLPSQTIIAGAASALFANYTLDASKSSEDVRVDSMKLKLTAPADSTQANISNCQLFDGGTALNTGIRTVNPAPTVADSLIVDFVFDSPLTVTRSGGIKTLSLKCNVAAGTVAGTTYAWGIDAAHVDQAHGVTSGQAFTPAVTSSDGVTVTTQSSGLSSSRIQGLKLIGGDSKQAPPSQEKIFLDGGEITSTNPFYLDNVSSGKHTVSVSVPAGWTVGYSYCVNEVSAECHAASRTPDTFGNTATVDVPRGGFIDLYWHFLPPDVVSQPKGAYQEIKKVLDRPNAWDHAPSVIGFPSEDPNKVYIFWCSTDKDSKGQASDSIWYTTYNISTGQLLRDSIKVLGPSSSGWDSRHTCDPSVINGEFHVSGQVYNYALYYTGTDHSWAKARVGVAFSNDLVNWVKYGSPVISPSVLSETSYGTGSQSVYSADGKSSVRVFYSDTSSGKSLFYYRRASDGINFGSAVAISTQGLPDSSLINSPTFAHDYLTTKWYLTTGVLDTSRGCSQSGGPLPHTEIKTYVTDSLESGTWTEIASVINSNNSIIDHNPGFLTDNFGNVTSYKATLPTFFGHGWCWDLQSWGLSMARGGTSTVVPPPPPPSTKFSIGDRIQTTVAVTVRDNPAGNSFGTQALGAQGKVVGGPQYAVLNGTGYWWWNIDYDAAPDGWSAEDYFEKVAVASPKITVISPNGGEIWEIGKTYNILWNGNSLEGKKGFVILNKAGMSGINLAENYDLSLGKFSWIVENKLTPLNPSGNDFTIYVGVGSSDPTVSDRSDAPFSIVTPPTAGTNNSQFLFQGSPSTLTLTTGQQSSMTMSFKNTGTSIWTKGPEPYGYKLGSQNPQDNTNWGFSRVELGETDSIAPGQQKDFGFVITAPQTPGKYNFQWRMVKENVEWFGTMSDNVAINVIASCTTPPTNLQPTGVLYNQSKVTLSWNPVPNVKSYTVKLNDGTADRYDDPRFAGMCTGSYYCETGITQTSILDVPVNPNRKYNYSVEPVFEPAQSYCAGSTTFTTAAIKATVGFSGQVLSVNPSANSMQVAVDMFTSKTVGVYPPTPKTVTVIPTSTATWKGKTSISQIAVNDRITSGEGLYQSDIQTITASLLDFTTPITEQITFGGTLVSWSQPNPPLKPLGTLTINANGIYTQSGKLLLAANKQIQATVTTVTPILKNGATVNPSEWNTKFVVGDYIGGVGISSSPYNAVIPTYLLLSSGSPILIKISPSTLVAGAQTTAVLRGINFKQGARLLITGPTGSAEVGPEDSQWKWISPTEFQWTTTPTIADVGAWTVRIKNLDGGISNVITATVVAPVATAQTAASNSNFASAFEAIQGQLDSITKIIQGLLR